MIPGRRPKYLVDPQPPIMFYDLDVLRSFTHWKFFSLPFSLSMDFIGVCNCIILYLYAVFVQVLLTDEGKTFVRQHQKDFDAQEIYRSLVEFHSQSMHAELTGTSIMSFFTLFKPGINPWAGKTSVSFIGYFVEQIRLYDELMLSSNNHVQSDSFKVSVLDQAVLSYAEV